MSSSGEEAKAWPSPVIITISEDARQLLILAFFAILGVLARVALTNLTSYDGAYVGGVIWPNFTSCLIMGMLVQSSCAWRIFDKDDKTQVMLYVGLTTGFCGSFSSFSSLVLEMFLKSANLEPNTDVTFRNAAGYGIMEFFSVVITQMCVSVASFHFGRHIIRLYDPVIPAIQLLEHVCVVLGALSWIAVICLMAVVTWRTWMFSCVVSPIACWIRYYLAKKLNRLHKHFPPGTFLANISATLVLAILVLVNRGRTATGQIISSRLPCQLTLALEDGFSGTLSTVSTFVVEVCNIKSVNSYIYGSITIILSYSIMVIVLGSYSWTNGLIDPVC